MYMKRKNNGMVIATIIAVTLGAVVLGLAFNNVRGQSQKALSESTTLEIDYESTGIMEDETLSDNLNLDELVSDKFVSNEVEHVYAEDPNIVYFFDTDLSVTYENEDSVIYAKGVYRGQEFTVRDYFVDSDTAKANGEKILDYVFSVVDKNILTQYGIDKTEYEYSIQRQYHYKYGYNYGVFLIRYGKIICTMGVSLEGEPVLTSFYMDGASDVYGSKTRPIPDEYLVENWCKTVEQKEAIYAEYFEDSKEIIEGLLGLPAVKECEKDMECISYFRADDSCSYVTLGYVLENGLYVIVSYNRVNNKFIGFAISGYHKDYYDVAK